MKVFISLLDFIKRQKEMKALKQVDIMHFKANEYLKEGRTQEAMVLISKANDLSNKLKRSAQ